MSKTQHHTKQQSQKPQKTWMPHWLQLAILGGVMLLVAGVLILKNWAADPAATAESGPQATAILPEAPMQATETLHEATGQPQAMAELEQVGSQEATSASPDELPEAHLERLLTAGQPTLSFFHSNNCVQCIKMTEVVEQVYPEFADSVALVDVDVYDQRNASFLQRARIRAIPTQIFFDQTGQGTVVVGAMSPGQFRERMQAVVGRTENCEDLSDLGVCAP